MLTCTWSFYTLVSGAYLRDLKVKPKQVSDMDSIRTEDFEDKFLDLSHFPSRQPGKHILQLGI